MKVNSKILCLVLACAFFSHSCSDTKPKTLGSKFVDFDDDDSTTVDSFSFNFAYQDSTYTNLIYLQGAVNTKTTMISTCNSAGTNCACEFLDEDGEILDTTDYDEIEFDSSGNYFRCLYGGNVSLLAGVRIRNQNSTVISDSYAIETSATLSAARLLGSDMDVNRIRTISRYTCLHNYLQKAGTSATYFDCSNQTSHCWNSGGSSGDFCLLQSSLPYYLYTDGYQSNVNLKIPDKVYNRGDNKICGLQIKEFNCSTQSGVLVKQFGLYGEQVGIFETSISLAPAPGLSATTYGYAAQTSTATINGISVTVCPPGLEKKVFYQATTSTSGLGNGSNYPDATAVREIGSPSSVPSSLEVNRVGGGTCNSTTLTCTLPSQTPARVANFDYSVPTGQTEFCVIPASML